MSGGDPMPPDAKPLVWLHGEIKTPPFSAAARREAGFLLWRLQRNESIGMPQSRPMPSIGPRCHELRINDKGVTWRVFYRLDGDAILIAGVEEKKTPKTPKAVTEKTAARLAAYDRALREAEKSTRRKEK